MATKVRDKELLSLHSEWVGDSQMRVRVVKIRNSDKLVIDVMELTHHRITRSGTALKLARNAARKFGAMCMDATQIAEFKSNKMAYRVDSDKPYLVKLRHHYFVFSGVA